MKEITLKKYLQKKVSVDAFATDLKDSQTNTGFDTISIHVEQIKESGGFQISINDLIRLCDNV